MAYLTQSELAERRRKYEAEKPDLCSHRIFRENCTQCPPLKPKKTPAEIKAMMACRNAIVAAQDIILNHKWLYLETKVDAHYMFSMLLKYGKKAWAPTQKVFLPSHEAGMSRHTLYRLQKSAIDAGVLVETGEKSKLGYPKYIISFDLIREWVKKSELEREIQQKFRNLERTAKVDPEDAAEEEASFAAEEYMVPEEDDGLNVVENAFVTDSDGLG